MSFTKRLRSWFFRGNAPINPNVLDENGNATLRDNLANRGVPTQSTMQDLTASAAFFTESNDRARLSTGGAIENEVGLVTVAPDTDVVNAGVRVGNTGLEADGPAARTKVVQASQLTEVDEISQSIPLTNNVPAYNDVIVEKNQDVGTTTHNKYISRIKQGFLDWIVDNILPRLIPNGGTENQVLSKVDGTDYNVQWGNIPVPGGDTYHEVALGYDEVYTIGTNSENVLYVTEIIAAVPANGTYVYPTVNFPAGPTEGDTFTIKTVDINIPSARNVIKITSGDSAKIDTFVEGEIGTNVGITFKYNTTHNAWKVLHDYVPVSASSGLDSYGGDEVVIGA